MTTTQVKDIFDLIKTVSTEVGNWWLDFDYGQLDMLERENGVIDFPAALLSYSENGNVLQFTLLLLFRAERHRRTDDLQQSWGFLDVVEDVRDALSDETYEFLSEQWQVVPGFRAVSLTFQTYDCKV